MKKKTLIYFVVFLIFYTLSVSATENKEKDCYIEKQIINQGGEIEILTENVDCFYETLNQNTKIFSKGDSCEIDFYQGTEKNFESVSIDAKRYWYQWSGGVLKPRGWIEWNDWINITQWLKNSTFVGKRIGLGTNDLENPHFIYSEIFEIEVPENINKINIDMDYILHNEIIDIGLEEGKGLCFNSNYFLFNFSIYDFTNQVWENFYKKEDFGCSTIRHNKVISTQINPNFIKNNKIKLKVFIENHDSTTSAYCVGSGNECYILELKKLKYNYCYNPPSYELYPSISYNTDTEKLKIEVYIYDKEQGREISYGSVSYKIKNSSGNVIDSGVLFYNSNLSVWKTEKTGRLESGKYEIEFNANGFIEKTDFNIGTGFAKIYGDIKDEKGNKIDDVEITVYNSIEFPYKILDSLRFDKNYSFLVAPGSYILTASKDDKIFVSISFSVFGGQEVRRELILTDKESEIKFLLNEIKEELKKKIDRETEKMSELTSLASADLEKDAKLIDEVGDFYNLSERIVSGITKGEFDDPADLIEQIIRKIIKYKNYRKNYQDFLKASSNLTRQNFLSAQNSEKMLQTLSWMTESSEGYKQRSKQELQSQEFYQQSLNSIDGIHDSASFTPNKNFDFSKLRRVVNNQLTQFKNENISSNFLISPNPEDEMIYWGFDDYYLGYLYNQQQLESAKKAGEISGDISTKALYIGNVAGVTASILTIWLTPAVSVPTGVVTTFVVTKSVSLTISALAKFVQTASEIKGIDLHSSLVQNFIFASSEWILDATKTPQVYSSTISLIEKETENPYYLHKDKNFDSDLKIKLNPDKIEEGKKIFLKKSSEETIIKNVTITLKNLLDPALTRVLAESKVEFEKTTHQSGYDYFSEYLDTAQEIETNMTLYGLWENELEMTPQIFIAESFSGPFQTSIEKEHFYVLKKSLYESIFESKSSFVQLSENEWEKIKTSKMPIRNKDKQLTLKDFIDYLPEIKDIYPEKEIFKIKNFNKESTRTNDLSKENPEFIFDYTMGENYGVEFQLFYSTGTDVDLYVYSEDSYIGFNVETGENEIGFPGIYSGKYERPEIIYIPKATNKTYKVKSVLVKEDSNLSTPIKISALEIPFRPALLSLWAPINNITIFLDENLTIDFLISEIGGQQPIENVSIEFEITGLNKNPDSISYIDKINAGELFKTNFDLQPTATGSFVGVLKVNSSAGYLDYSVVINVVEENLLEGDTNHDCKVDIFDLEFIDLHYRSKFGEDKWSPDADLNKDKKVDIFDLAIVGINYGGEC